MLLWSIAAAIGLAVIYGLNAPKRLPGDTSINGIDDVFDPNFMNSVEPLSLAENAIYGGFHRFAWSVAIGWVVFACCRGYGGKSNISGAYIVTNYIATIMVLLALQAS